MFFGVDDIQLRAGEVFCVSSFFVVGLTGIFLVIPFFSLLVIFAHAYL